MWKKLKNIPTTQTGIDHSHNQKGQCRKLKFTEVPRKPTLNRKDKGRKPPLKSVTSEKTQGFPPKPTINQKALRKK